MKIKEIFSLEEKGMVEKALDEVEEYISISSPEDIDKFLLSINPAMHDLRISVGALVYTLALKDQLENRHLLRDSVYEWIVSTQGEMEAIAILKGL